MSKTEQPKCAICTEDVALPPGQQLNPNAKYRCTLCDEATKNVADFRLLYSPSVVLDSATSSARITWRARPREGENNCHIINIPKGVSGSIQVYPLNKALLNVSFASSKASLPPWQTSGDPLSKPNVTATYFNDNSPNANVVSGRMVAQNVLVSQNDAKSIVHLVDAPSTLSFRSENENYLRILASEGSMDFIRIVEYNGAWFEARLSMTESNVYSSLSYIFTLNEETDVLEKTAIVDIQRSNPSTSWITPELSMIPANPTVPLSHEGESFLPRKLYAMAPTASMSRQSPASSSSASSSNEDSEVIESAPEPNKLGAINLGESIYSVDIRDFSVSFSKPELADTLQATHSNIYTRALKRVTRELFIVPAPGSQFVNPANVSVFTANTRQLLGASNGPIKGLVASKDAYIYLTLNARPDIAVKRIEQDERNIRDDQTPPNIVTVKDIELTFTNTSARDQTIEIREPLLNLATQSVATQIIRQPIVWKTRHNFAYVSVTVLAGKSLSIAYAISTQQGLYRG